MAASNQPAGADGGADLAELIAAALWEHDEDQRSDDPVKWADWLDYVRERPVRTLVAEIERYRDMGSAVVATLASACRIGPMGPLTAAVNQILSGATPAAPASTARAEAGDWVTVPRRPLPEMLGAFWRVKNTGSTEPGEFGEDRSDVAAYRAMIEAAPAVPASPISTGAEDDAEDSYKLGKRDGYQEGVQDAALRAGHHGEYFYSTLPGQGCPDPETMLDQIEGIVDALRAGRESVSPAPAEHGVEIRELRAAAVEVLGQSNNLIRLRPALDRLEKAVRAVPFSPHQGPETGGQGAGREGEGRVPAWDDVLAERRRQVDEQGWTARHDDRHANGQLAEAASILAAPPYAAWRPWLEKRWPWGVWSRKGPYRRDLVKAGALILAEIERWDRISVPVDRSPAGAETHSGSVGDESAVTGAAGQAPSVPSPTNAKTGEV